MSDGCNHEWVDYSQCCYCGAYKNFSGRVIEQRTQSNVEEVRQQFIEWWNGVKETNGGYPPLAMQVFHWFDTHIGIFDSITHKSGN